MSKEENHPPFLEQPKVPREMTLEQAHVKRL